MKLAASITLYLNYDAGHADTGAGESVPIKDLVDVAVEAEAEEVGVDDGMAAQNHGPGPDEATEKCPQMLVC